MEKSSFCQRVPAMIKQIDFCDFCLVKCTNSECDLIPRGNYVKDGSNSPSDGFLDLNLTVDIQKNEKLLKSLFDSLNDVSSKYSKTRNDKLTKIDWDVYKYMERSDKL